MTLAARCCLSLSTAAGSSSRRALAANLEAALRALASSDAWCERRRAPQVINRTIVSSTWASFKPRVRRSRALLEAKLPRGAEKRCKPAKAVDGVEALEPGVNFQHASCCWCLLGVPHWRQSRRGQRALIARACGTPWLFSTVARGHGFAPRAAHAIGPPDHGGRAPFPETPCRQRATKPAQPARAGSDGRLPLPQPR